METSVNLLPVVEIIIGTGIVSMLWQMNKQIGALAAEMKRFSTVITDHEDRIRSLEKETK